MCMCVDGRCVYMYICEDGRCVYMCVCEDGRWCTCACVRMGVCVHVHV